MMRVRRFVSTLALSAALAVAVGACHKKVPAAAPAGQPGSYYFCRSANAYYPQVSQCAEGWQQVAPKPPGT